MKFVPSSPMVVFPQSTSYTCRWMLTASPQTIKIVPCGESGTTFGMSTRYSLVPRQYMILGLGRLYARQMRPSSPDRGSWVELTDWARSVCYRERLV